MILYRLQKVRPVARPTQQSSGRAGASQKRIRREEFSSACKAVKYGVRMKGKRLPSLDRTLLATPARPLGARQRRTFFSGECWANDGSTFHCQSTVLCFTHFSTHSTTALYFHSFLPNGTIYAAIPATIPLGHRMSYGHWPQWWASGLRHVGAPCGRICLGSGLGQRFLWRDSEAGQRLRLGCGQRVRPLLTAAAPPASRCELCGPLTNHSNQQRNEL